MMSALMTIIVNMITVDKISKVHKDLKLTVKPNSTSEKGL